MNFDSSYLLWKCSLLKVEVDFVDFPFADVRYVTLGFASFFLACFLMECLWLVLALLYMAGLFVCLLMGWLLVPVDSNTVFILSSWTLILVSVFEFRNTCHLHRAIQLYGARILTAIEVNRADESQLFVEDWNTRWDEHSSACLDIRIPYYQYFTSIHLARLCNFDLFDRLCSVILSCPVFSSPLLCYYSTLLYNYNRNPPPQNLTQSLGPCLRFSTPLHYTRNVCNVHLPYSRVLVRISFPLHSYDHTLAHSFVRLLINAWVQLDDIDVQIGTPWNGH